MNDAPNYRLPVKRAPSPLPVPIWRQAAPVVARGAALVAAGIIGEWLLRSAARKAVSAPLGGGKNRAVARREESHSPSVVAYSEEIIVRRTIVRR